MAYTDYSAQGSNHSETRLSADGQTVELPDASFVRDADIARDGADLVLSHDGQTVVIEGYYAADPQPNLVAPDGATLTPDLVDSFTKSAPEFASNQTASDASPVGAVQEVTGKATITHTDGTVENVTVGTPIFQGDIIETDAKGAVNIVFSDNTSFAVSQDARLAIDEYVYDPATQSGSTDFSVLKGMFVFTSGLIGRDDPDDVHIKTPAGSIGIRGTIIAGNVDTGEITVVEGAIVLHDHNGHEVTLASQFETARFGGNEGIEHMGQLSAHDVSARFSSVSSVSPTLFSSINDVTNDSGESSGEGGEAGTGESSGEEGDAPEGAAQPEGEPHTDAAPVAPAAVMASGFGNTSGLAPSGNAFAPTGSLPPPPPPAGFAPPPGSSGFAADLGTHTANTAGDILPPPPPVTTYDPNAGTTTTPPANLAPVNQRMAPAGFFESVESNLQWNYHFDKEFYDPEHPAAQLLTFKLSNQTIIDLNNWTSDGAGAHPDILLTAMGTGLSSVTGDEGRGWTFNESNGQLTLYMNNAFDAIAVGPGNHATLTVSIEAVDPQGASGGLQNYTFNAYDPDVYVSTSFSHTADGKIVGQSSGLSAGTIAGDNNRFYLGNGNDILTIDNDGVAGNTASYNYVNVGRGQNLVTVESDALHNIVVGGDDNDKIILRTAQVEAYGMDGDDTFIIDLNSGSAPNLLAELNTAGSNTVIDGGHSNFRAGAALTADGVPTPGLTGGRGDTLQLEAAGTLDFTQIVPTNRIMGIERLDMIGTTSVANTVVLRYQDVLNMTGHENGLIINMDGNDTLTLVGSEFNLSNMIKVRDNFIIDDAANGQAADNKAYDVYTDGNVTLLIHDQSAGSAAVTFDGTSVAV
ncbi:MAG: FecR domain-containing protein [Alphaproteobacteria bacterium]|nr:FecR domain-containing protein [Alphaproteobacteria bacterium]